MTDEPGDLGRALREYAAPSTPPAGGAQRVLTADAADAAAARSSPRRLRPWCW